MDKILVQKKSGEIEFRDKPSNQYDLIVQAGIQKCLKDKLWAKEEKDAMRRYLIKRKELKRDVQPEDIKDDPDMLRMMVAITKKYPKKEIKKEMAKQIKELGFAREEF